MVQDLRVVTDNVVVYGFFTLCHKNLLLQVEQGKFIAQNKQEEIVRSVVERCCSVVLDLQVLVSLASHSSPTALSGPWKQQLTKQSSLKDEWLSCSRAFDHIECIKFAKSKESILLASLKSLRADVGVLLKGTSTNTKIKTVFLEHFSSDTQHEVKAGL